MLSECVIKTLKYFFLKPATTRSKYRKKGQTQQNFHKMSELYLPALCLSCSLSLSFSFWPQAKWVPGRAGLPQWRLMFLTQHSPSHLQPSRPLKGRPALRSPDGWWGNLQEQLEEACVYSAPFNEEREGLSLAWISPGTRRRGKNKTKKKKGETKEKTAAPHVVLPLTTPADFRHKRGSEGKGGGKKMRERGLLCPCISSPLSALPHPDVPIAKPVGRRERLLGRGLAGFGWKKVVVQHLAQPQAWVAFTVQLLMVLFIAWCYHKGNGGFLSQLYKL